MAQDGFRKGGAGQGGAGQGFSGKAGPGRGGAGGGGGAQQKPAGGGGSDGGAPEKELAVPDVAARDVASFELLRVWVAEQSQQITLRPGIWEDPSAWGVMLADLARSIVKVHAENDENLDTEAFLASVLEGFDTEIESVLEEFGAGEEE